jgi:2-polyprenyl-3-methyl-5-hydroxy-6-metoxy-1,4-benzoquinol methylase
MDDMISLTADNLDCFVRRIDALGGPGHPAARAMLDRAHYQPATSPDTSLDPFGPQWLQQQLDLHREISGRGLDQAANEQVDIDIDRHVAAPNAYDHWFPKPFSDHLTRLLSVLRLADPRRGSILLDMGCGWGLSSEFMAQAGLQVVAMDINPQFVALVNRRAARLGLPITAHIGEFDHWGPAHPVDQVLFYECLHHALRPWEVLRRFATTLNKDPGCHVLMAGEPVQAHWWPHWGLRLDGESLYVMRKHGWFESGFSLDFIRRCLALAGLEPIVENVLDPALGQVLAGRWRALHGMAWLQALAESEGITADGRGGLTLTADATMRFGALPRELALVMHLHNPGPGPLNLQISANHMQEHVLLPGPNVVTIAGIQGGARLVMELRKRSLATRLLGDGEPAECRLEGFDFPPR